MSRIILHQLCACGCLCSLKIGGMTREDLLEEAKEAASKYLRYYDATYGSGRKPQLGHEPAGAGAAAAAAAAAPVAESHSQPVPLKQCAACGAAEAPDRRLKKCAGCRIELYCSAECQTQRWPQHKAACKVFRQAAAAAAVEASSV